MQVPIIDRGIAGLVLVVRKTSKLDREILKEFSVKTSDEINISVIKKCLGNDISELDGGFTPKGKLIITEYLKRLGLSSKATLKDIVQRFKFFIKRPDIDERFHTLREGFDFIFPLPNMLNKSLKAVYDSIMEKPWSEKSLIKNFNTDDSMKHIFSLINNPDSKKEYNIKDKNIKNEPIINQDFWSFIRAYKKIAQIDKNFLASYNVSRPEDITAKMIVNKLGEELFVTSSETPTLSSKGQKFLKEYLKSLGLSTQANFENLENRIAFFKNRPDIFENFTDFRKGISIWKSIFYKLTQVKKCIYNAMLNKPWSEENLTKNFGNNEVVYKILEFLKNP